MRGQFTVEEMVERMKRYLDCPCTYFPPAADDKPILDAYSQARKRGKKERFVPMLVVVDELLMECFEINSEDKTTAQVRQELLSAPLASGKELLQGWCRNVREDREEYWEELAGSTEDGEALTSFLSLRDFSGRGTVPVVLAEIPVSSPWEVFAYLPFGGWNDCPANEEHMAVAKYWFEEYGAVPALMTHDVLEYTLPASVPEDRAMDLALEQFAYCTDIVEQGVETIGRLADGLARSDVWYFWWD